MRYTKHLVIPDTQIRPGVPLGHIAAAGRFAAEKTPDVIVILGDWWDMPSMSQWETDTRKVERNITYSQDIEAGKAAMSDFLKPIRKRKGYNPQIHFTIGNHEDRINRYVQQNPVMRGVLGMESLGLAAHRIKVHPFLKPVVIDGISYCHYYCMDANGRVMNSKRGQASAKAQVQNVGMSATSGHKQGLDIHIKESPAGRRIGLICGSYYQHAEEYLSPQGNSHWSGVVMKHEVSRGQYDPMFVSLDFLLRRYT